MSKLKDEIENRFEGKVVATRGIGSGVLAGRCVAIEGNSIILTEAYFIRNWQYKTAYGAMHSLSKADVTSGEITEIKHEVIVTDLANAVVCDEKLLEICKKLGK